MRISKVCLAAAVALFPAGAFAQRPPVHNVILFVADGLRHGAVDDANTPAMAKLRHDGVDFVNSHSLFPTVTTPNASAIATGHLLGDTGDYANRTFMGALSQGDALWPLVHDFENDRLLREANEHFAGNYLDEQSLLALARQAGFQTAVIGKYGPALIQDVTRGNADITPENVGTVVIDDATGWIDPTHGRLGVPLRRDIAQRIDNDPYFVKTYFDGEKPEVEPPSAPRGENGTAGTHEANVHQQQYLIDTVTRAVLPAFADPAGGRKPFVLVFWSRDPDGSQHNAGDSEGKLVPGINNATVAKALRNADGNLAQLIDYLHKAPDPDSPGQTLADTTDVFLTSDHGFGTVSRKQLDAAGTRWGTFATEQHYANVPAGEVPQGLLAIDLAHDLDLPLFDADTVDKDASTATKIVHKKLRLASTPGEPAEHPADSQSMLGGGTVTAQGTDARLIIDAGGGAQTIFMPTTRLKGAPGDPADRELMQRVVAAAASKPYISGIWVDTDRFGPIPGALALSDIGLSGSSRTPRPAMVASMASFSTDPARPEMTGVQISDSGYKPGYGNHGTFGRHDTLNCMMAIGPDFKTTFSDTDPVSNADIAVTLGKILGLDLPAQAKGPLHGRVIAEALAGGPAPRGAEHLRKESAPAPTGQVTVLLYQAYKDDTGHVYPYFDAGGFPGRSVGLPR